MHDGSDQSTSNAHEDIDNQNRNEFTPLYTNVFDTGTLRLIIGFFFGFSVTVTIALGIQMYYGNTQVVVHGSVVSDNGQCSEIGAAIMKQGGNAVDAIIAVAFCMGIVNPHITGLGSGGLMLIYDQRQRKLLNVIDFRVTRSNHTVVGVPGFVAGLHLAHKLHGLLPWKQLVLPAEFVARTGFRVSSNLINSFSSLVKNMTNQHLKEHFSSLLLNQVMTNPDLADTLLHIATTDVAEFYNTILVDELRGFLDIEDIVNYKAFKSIGMKSSFLHYDIIVPGHGSGGSFLVNNLNLINNSLSPLVSAVEGFKTVADGWQSSVASHIATMDIADLYVTMVRSVFKKITLVNIRKILNAKSCVDTSPPKVLQMKINNHWRYSRGTSSLQPKIVSSDMKKQFQQESVLKRSNNPVICQYYYQHHIKEMESPNLNKSFVVPKKPFSPTILKSNAQSKLRNLRVYHPPRKKRVILNVSETSQSSLVKRDDQEEDTLPNHIFNQSNVNNMKKQPSTTVDNNYSEESSEDSAYNEGECVLSSDSRGSTPQNSSFAPQLMKKRLIPSENIFGTSKLSVISKKNAVNDIMCIQFLKDITNDIIKKNIFTNKALRSTFEYHVKINKYNLNTEIMLKEISILQERLGVPKDEKFDNEDYGLGKDISEDEIENVNEIKNDEELSISFCNNTIKEVNNGNNETENEENTKNESEENYSDSFSDIDNSSISKSDQTKSDLSISETDQTKSGEHDENDTDNDEEVASVHIEEINEEEEEEGGSEKFSITEQNYNKTANSETDSDLEISEIC